MSKSSCKLTPLAQTQDAAVMHCSCGHIHLHMGQVTLRLDESAFMDVAMLTQTAAAALHTIKESARPEFRVLHNEAYSG